MRPSTILIISGFPSLSLSAVLRTRTSTIPGSTVTVHTTPIVTDTVWITPSTSTIPGSTITIHTTPIITDTVWITPAAPEPPQTSKAPTTTPSAPSNPPSAPSKSLWTPSKPPPAPSTPYAPFRDPLYLPPIRPKPKDGLRKCERAFYTALGPERASIKTLDCVRMISALADDVLAPKEWFVVGERWQRLLRFRSCEFTLKAKDSFHITAQDVTDIVTNTTIKYPGPTLPGPWGTTRCRGPLHSARTPALQALGNWTSNILFTMGRGTVQVPDLQYAEESRSHVLPEYCWAGTEKACLPPGAVP